MNQIEANPIRAALISVGGDRRSRCSSRFVGTARCTSGIYFLLEIGKA